MLALLSRRKDNAMADSAPEVAQSDVLMRFLTRGGAEVHVLRDRLGFRCQGCDYGRKSSSATVYARDDANDHASTCWSMPKPDAA